MIVTVKCFIPDFINGDDSGDKASAHGRALRWLSDALALDLPSFPDKTGEIDVPVSTGLRGVKLKWEAVSDFARPSTYDFQTLIDGSWAGIAGCDLNGDRKEWLGLTDMEFIEFLALRPNGDASLRKGDS